MIVSKGSDQALISTKFEDRQNPNVVTNYGRLLIDLSAVVPDGIVAFFTSYRFMEDMITAWYADGILHQIMRHKLIFIETKDVLETTLSLDAYKKACDVGRGAVFFSVARGKVAEGIDFDRHYGRAVVMIGVPFQYTLSHVLQARLEYLQSHHNISDSDFLTFDALRQTSQVSQRALRRKCAVMHRSSLRFSVLSCV
jgi:DNA excision repair protein ERCC-2